MNRRGPPALRDAVSPRHAPVPRQATAADASSVGPGQSAPKSVM